MINLLYTLLCHDSGNHCVGERFLSCHNHYRIKCYHEFGVFEWDSAENYGGEAHAEASMIVSDATFSKLFTDCLFWFKSCIKLSERRESYTSIYE